METQTRSLSEAARQASRLNSIRRGGAPGTDCEYYLGAGNRCAKFLWAGTEQAPINARLALWDSFPEKRWPEWISREDILRYQTQMLGELAA